MKPTVHSSNIVHKNPWYQIRHDELTWPNGKPGEYFVMETPPAATILAVEEGEILVVEQYRHTIGRMSLEFVTGRTEPHEDPSIAAHREFEEESGYTAEFVEPIGTIDVLNGTTNHITHIFLAKNLQRTMQRLDDAEDGMRVRWIPLDEWRAMIGRGEVQNATTLAAWAIYQEMTR